MICTHRLGRAAAVAAVLVATVIAAQPVAADARTYVVRPHDTLSGIAATFGTTVRALMIANNLRDDGYIVVGQVLTIPDSASSSTAPTASLTCWSTAQRFPHDEERGRRWHDGRRWTQSACRGGQSLVVPTVSATPVSLAATSVPAGPAAAMPVTPTPLPSVQATGSVAVLLTAQAQAAGVDPALVKAVAWQESGWRMVIAADGGIGIMQLMPATVSWVETTLLDQSIDPYSAADNVRAGVAVLRYYLTVFGNERLAIAAYHQGLQSVRTQGVSAATQQYVADVLALQQQFAQ